jgi:hypothetical protein
MWALLRMKLHFGLLHVLDVLEVGSQLCQSLASASSNVKCLDATPFSYLCPATSFLVQKLW